MANKAGVCKCGHEIRYWHDPATGQCMVGREWKGHAPSVAGACDCVRKVKAKKMNGTTKTTHTVTVDGDGVLAAFDALIKAHEVGLHALRNLRAALLAGRTKTEGTRPITQLLEPAPAPSSRAEVPASAAPSRGDDAINDISAGAREVLHAIAQWSGAADTAQLVIATAYAPRTVSDYLSELSSAGLVKRSAGRATLVTQYQNWPAKPTLEQLRAKCLSSLNSGQAEVLQALFAAGGEETTEGLASATGFAHRTVSDYLSELSSRKLLTRAQGLATLHRDLGGPQ